MLMHRCLSIADCQVDRIREQMQISILAPHIMGRKLWEGGRHRCLICAHVLAPHRRHNARPGNDCCQKVPKHCLHPACARQMGLRHARSGECWGSQELEATRSLEHALSAAAWQTSKWPCQSLTSGTSSTPHQWWLCPAQCRPRGPGPSERHAMLSVLPCSDLQQIQASPL